MGLNASLVASIKSNLAKLSSDELRLIVTKRDRSQWSEESFEAARQLLAEREKGDSKEPGVLSPDDVAWQEGECSVVVRVSADLPPRCVRCNSSAASSVLNLTAGKATMRCLICPRHQTISAIAVTAARVGLATGVISLVVLFLTLSGALNAGWSFWVVFASLLAVALLYRFVWVRFSHHLNPGGSLLVQVQLGRVVVMLLFLGGLMTIITGMILVGGWRQGHHALVLMSTIPPAVGAPLLAFKLRIALTKARPGFVVLSGTGRRFRESLPKWPGYPRTAPVTSPRDVGRNTHI